MVLFLDPAAENKMVLYQDAGVCYNGKYAENDGLRDLKSCFEQCLAEPQCVYASFLDGGYDWNSRSTCTRFNNHDCRLSLLLPYDAKRYVTYKKVRKGAFTTLFVIYSVNNR